MSMNYLAEALRHGRGRIDLDEAKGAIHLQQALGTILRSGSEIATRETLDRERAMIASVNGGVGRFESLEEEVFSLRPTASGRNRHRRSSSYSRRAILPSISAVPPAREKQPPYRNSGAD
jgi:hypothetical protein